ncbi:MAG TPA: hypothetical protein VLV87_09040 [Gammaproteobacteria bacterium]|nr:hypothetical protein [Gammaproteobacteria bacterium]
MTIFRHGHLCAVLCLCLGACSVERWAVKTGTDADVGRVDLARSTATTIGALRALPAPSILPADHRVPPTETTQFTVAGRLKQYKLAVDSDYHLVIVDETGHTMIAEIPDPRDMDKDSPFIAGVRNARAEFDKAYKATYFFKSAGVPVCVKGIGFFDFKHGQPGVAPNGIELHPLLDIQFNRCPTSGQP